MTLAKLTCVFGLALAAAGCGGVDAKAKCTSDADCFEGYACDLAQTNQCMRRCDTTATPADCARPGNCCLASETCDPIGGGTAGVCRVTTTP